VSVLRLAKYHGLGNDFLVGTVAGGDGAEPIDAATGAALCDRHRGIGADGVIMLRRCAGGSAVRMSLRNADGGVAETSGNGLRCAALAALDGGLVAGPGVVIETAAGPARALLVARTGAGGATLRVSMGRALLGEVRAGVLGRSARMVDVGNPHLVLYEDTAPGAGTGLAPGTALHGLHALHALPALLASELAGLEHGVDGEVPGGLNVEAVRVLATPGGAGRDAVELVVWERGAGETQACGSGSVAAAAALRAAGLVGGRVEVRNPGGTLHVELTGPLEAPEAELTGPAQLVARFEVDPAWLAGAARPGTEGVTAAS
jgi:diaminopimelate epimerase